MKKKVLQELELLESDSIKSQLQLQAEKEKIIFPGTETRDLYDNWQVSN